MDFEFMYTNHITNTLVEAGLRHGTAVSPKLSHVARVLVLHSFVVMITHDPLTRIVKSIRATINVPTVFQRLVF
jgi:hypothetical protein